MTQVFVVVGSQGESSDWSMWLVRSFSSSDEASRHAMWLEECVNGWRRKMRATVAITDHVDRKTELENQAWKELVELGEERGGPSLTSGYKVRYEVHAIDHSG